MAARTDPFPAVRLTGSPPVYELRNGLWFNGTTFEAGTRYTVYGHLTDRQPVPVDSVIDLNGAHVVPPFSETHNHNPIPSDTATTRRYLAAGIFYAKNPNNFPRDRDAAAGVFNTPTSLDVTFSNGGLTGPGGHPIGLARRNIARGTWRPGDGEGMFYFSFANRADVDARWASIVAARPDFIKTYLLFSEEYAQRLADTATVGWRGLDPALLPYIIDKAHRAGLRVSTHVETAADFRAAVAAGADEINHLPGFRPEGNDPRGYGKIERYRLTADDARTAARHGVVVVTTVSEMLELADQLIRAGGPQAALAEDARALISGNLRLLHQAGVSIAIGSDRYRANSVPEVFALRGTGVFSDTALLRMWSTTSARTIFPNRKIGALVAGYEASFLALDGNPLTDFESVRRIRLRMKQGVLLP